MTVHYDHRKGHLLPYYLCQKRGIESAQAPCQSIPGAGLDNAISRIVLETLTPASLEVALEVFEELRARKAEINRLHHAQLQRAREEAELAQRQFMAVRPENRLVADSLERLWNEKLAELSKAEEEYAHAVKAADPGLSQHARDRIHALVSDLPRVWNDPRTPSRERKRILRLLVEDVTLTRDRTIQLHIRWKGGATTSLEQPLPLTAPDLRRTPAAVVEQVRALATEQTDRQIAETLNSRFLRTGTGKRFARLIVRGIREAYGIRSLAQHLRAEGWLTVREVAARLGVHYQTAKSFASEGVLCARRASDNGDILFQPLSGPLPGAQPGKRFRDRRRYPKLAPRVGEKLQYEA